MTKQTLLEQLEAAGCLIDLDSYDPDSAKAMPFAPHDATCNTFIMGDMIQELRHREIVMDVLKESKDLSPLDVFDKLHATFGARVLPCITGRVYAQVSAKFRDDEQAIVDHAVRFTEAYGAAGVSKDRLCIKIPATSAGVKAGAVLQKQGIATLGTAVFSLAQAVAASQAEMHAISPYFNAIIAFLNTSYWPDVANPAKDHPMAPRILQISQTFAKLKEETGKRQPELKGAGYITGREVWAQHELGCDHVTVMPASIMDLLAFTQLPPYREGERDARISNPDLPTQTPILEEVAQDDPLKFIPQSEAPSSHPDYLQGGELDAAIDADPVAKARLAQAMAFFVEAEEKALAFIEQLRATLN